MRLTALLVGVALVAWLTRPAAQSYGNGSIQPGTCVPGSTHVSTTAATFAICTANNTWTAVATPSSVPTGAIIFISSGTCGSGYAEATDLDGKTVELTATTHSDVGTTGGSDTRTPTGTLSVPTLTMNSYTPAGSVAAPIFTGASAVSSAVTAGTPAGTNGASATSGNCAATNVAIGTGATNACKATAPNLTVTAQTFTGSALATHSHTVTATGTNSAPAFTGGAATLTGSVTAPTFTGASADTRSAFVKLIPCRKS